VSEAAPALRATGIHKRFGGVTALAGVDMTVERGSIHGLIGANGAGKSTLVKIVNGVHRPDAGEIAVGGRRVAFGSPRDARTAGIAMVYQEFSLIPTLSVAHNILLGREPRTRGGLTDERATRVGAAGVLADLGVQVDPGAMVGSLPVGAQQLVEIAKAVATEPAILVLDEPTASLSTTEVAELVRVVRALRDRGVAIVYISHHLAEVRATCDAVTVLRDGRVTLAGPVAGIDLGAIVGAMTGRSLAETRPPARAVDRSGIPVLELRGRSLGTRLTDVSLAVHPGEILGVAGLLGSGRTSLLRSIVGLERGASGELLVGGRAARPRSPADAADAGVAYVPEDRRRDGIVTGQSVEANHLLGVWDRLARHFLLDGRVARSRTEEAIATLGIRTSGPGQPIEQLSGGNQQKVVVARALARHPAALLLDDPTAGIDIASRRELLGHLRTYAEGGGAVLLVSSELDELASVADRVAVLDRGRVVAVLGETGGAPLTEAGIHAAIHAASAPIPVPV